MSAYQQANDSLWLSSDEDGAIGEDYDEYDHVGDDGGPMGALQASGGAERRYPPQGNISHAGGIARRNKNVYKSSSPNNSKLRANSNQTLSLSDFEEEFFDRDDDKSTPLLSRQLQPVNSSISSNNRKRPQLSRLDPLSSKFRPLQRRPGSGGGVRVWGGDGVRRYWQGFAAWLSKSSKLKIVILGCILGLLCAVGVQKLRMATASNDNLLLCANLNNKQPCLTPSQLQPALSLAHRMRDTLHTRAGLFVCGGANVTSENATLKELLPDARDREVLQHVLLLTLANPQWEIRWQDFKGVPVTSSPNMEDVLSSSARPRPSLACRAARLVTELWSITQTVLIVVMVIFAIVAVAMWYIRKREREMTAMYIMVEKILEVLRHHYEATRKQKDLIPYLAIIHVRDMLIQPSERQVKQVVWGRACAWIAQHESRVRAEQRRIAGEDFQVWRWIQVDPPKTEEPPGEQSKRRNFWQGSTLEEYTAGALDAKFAPPAGSPSRCIRLKNMFEAISHMDDEQSLEIQNSLLDRCVPHGDVVHVYIDRKSTFGCVYVKMASLQAAKGAYKSLHGGWYKGKLVTAKFIPEPKYHKWFPHAAKATVAMFPN